MTMKKTEWRYRTINEYRQQKEDRFIIKAVAICLFVLGLAIFIGLKAKGQVLDTTMYRNVQFYIGPALKFDSTFKFVLPKPRPQIIVIRDTVKVHDTTYVIKVIYKDTGSIKYIDTCIDDGPILPIDSAKLAWSRFKTMGYTFKEYIHEVQKLGAIALIDVDVTPAETIFINGDIIVESLPGVTVTNYLAGPLWLLGNGLHIFRNMSYAQTDSLKGVVWRTALPATGQPPYVFHDSIRNVSVEGGNNSYYSDRGGSKSQWSKVSISQAIFKNRHVNIMVFGQDVGNYKSLLLDSVELWSWTSHNGYVHTDISVQATFVRSMQIGPNAVAWHGYSSGGGEGGKGTADSSEYQIFKFCYSAPAGGRWQIPQPYTIRLSPTDSIVRPVQMIGCNLPLYDIPIPKMEAVNCTFTYGPFNGTCTNCSGVYRPQNNSTIINSTAEMSVQEGGVITLVNSTATKMYDSDRIAPLNPLRLHLDNSIVNQMKLVMNVPNYLIYLKGNSAVLAPLFGWTPWPIPPIHIVDENEPR